MDLKLFLTEQGQMALFEKPNAAELFIEYTSYSRALHDAVDLKLFGEVPKVGRLTSEDFRRVVRSVQTPEEQAVLDQILAQLSPRDVHTLHRWGSCLCAQAQVKIFDFSKDVIEKILANNSIGFSCKIGDEAQIRLVEVFSAQEIKVLCEQYHIRLCDEALLKAFELFSKDEFAVVLAAAPSLSVNMFQEILARLSKEEAKALLLAFLEQDGFMWDEIHRRILKNFSKDDAKEIFLKQLEKRGFLGDAVKVDIWRNFPSEDTLEIFKASSQVEKTVDDEVLLLVVHRFLWLLPDYIKNGVELSDKVQFELLYEIDKDDAAEILLAYKERGGKLCREAKRFLKKK